jgi:poly(3-hydroxyalkanoate) synthetase
MGDHIDLSDIRSLGFGCDPLDSPVDPHLDDLIVADNTRELFATPERQPGDLYVDPDHWQAENELVDGSWWPAWNAWLDAHSSLERVAPPKMGNAKAGYKPLRDAPGIYVFG